MRKHKLWLLIAFLVIAAFIGAAVYLRAKGAPEAARLLPESDAIIYVNLRPVRLATHLGEKPISHEPEYEDFVRETGFQIERDLDEAAIAVHPPELSSDGKQTEPQRRFSEIFVGRFDSVKLVQYLHKISSVVEQHGGHDIFLVPHEGRPVRVSILSVDTVAVSNTGDPKNIHHMIDQFHKLAMPVGGNRLLRAHYSDVPFGSSAWAITQLSAPNGQGSSLPLPGGINFALPKDTMTVSSLRYEGSIQFKVQAFTSSEEAAQQLTSSASNFLTLFRAVETSVNPKGPDQDVKTFFDSIRVQQDHDRAVLSAEMPQGFIAKVLTDVPDATNDSAPAPTKSNDTPPDRKTKKHR